MDGTQDVLFEVMKGHHHSLGLITLNRPTVLNSLNHGIIQAMTAQLKQWARDNTVRAVIIQSGGGRAFCAGGDLRSVYESAKSNDPTMDSFFADEYELNRLIFHYNKPYIAFLDGITMGGGVGISIHGSHRIGTDRLLFSMPETGIGFFPDVGGTYFLPRLSHEAGIYLGLTGARITIDMARSFGLVTHKVSEDALPSIIDDLLKTPLYAATAKEAVSHILDKRAIHVDIPNMESWQAEINGAFQHNSIEAILTALKFSNSEFLEDAKDMLLKKSPTSLKVTLRALREGNTLSFDACMKQELILTKNFLRSHDFIEGIRAIIIDKDQNPQWKPKDLSGVTDQDVIRYFQEPSSIA